MAHPCPHCKEPLEGFITQEKHTERLKAKDDANALLTTKITELSEKAASAESVGADLAKLRAEHTGLTRRLKLSEHGISDPAVVSAMEAIHRSLADGDDAPEFEAFDAWAKDHVLLKQYFSAPPPAGQPPPPGVPPPRVPKDQGNVQPPPPPQGRMTPQQLRAHFQSAEFRAKSPDDQRAERTRLQAEYASSP